MGSGIDNIFPSFCKHESENRKTQKLKANSRFNCKENVNAEHPKSLFVFGVDAVKGPCAVSIFSVLCVLLVIVIANRVGGWGGMLTFFATARFSCTSTHTSCYATLLLVSLAHSHIRHATLLLGFSCTFTHTSCYATARFLFHIHTYVMLRYC